MCLLLVAQPDPPKEEEERRPTGQRVKSRRLRVEDVLSPGKYSCSFCSGSEVCALNKGVTFREAPWWNGRAVWTSAVSPNTLREEEEAAARASTMAEVWPLTAPQSTSPGQIPGCSQMTSEPAARFANPACLRRIAKGLTP